MSEAEHDSAELIGQRVSLLTTFRQAFHGLLENVSEEGVHTVSIRDGLSIQKFNIPKDQVKSCKPITHETGGKRR